MKEEGCCPICSSITKDVLTRKLRRGEGIVFHCRNCDLGFLWSTSASDLEKYYARDYRQHVSHKAEPAPTNPEEIFEAYRRYQGDRLKIVIPLLEKDSSILEIGASAGQFLRNLDWNGVRRCAIEPDPACCEFMKRMDIETDDKMLAQSRFRVEQFNVIAAFQVLEHTEDPIFFLKTIKSMLKPGGKAVIEVPNLHDALRGVWGIPEYQAFYFHSDHRFYFTARSLRAISKLAGFKNPEIRYTQDYNLLNHLHWLMNRAPQPDCHVGLGPVAFQGKSKMLTEWLSGELHRLNGQYIEKLTSIGCTSNITMILEG
jgi:2-polyprenyl-3-methyl-5-hydroxy-6-metoxy-1,4-benzoquinol methylase